ncbi:DUF6919 domain-containing protein [Streptomyces sp. NPDC058464]|uniref:DUF6919 domain-containing protein n=1 Tax=Streptomyces sp. NPDC058464 TaxID=3346511 RepID=UPI003649003D
MFGRWRQIRADRKQWAQAETLADLGQLMAAWLEGDMAWRAGAWPDLDPETNELVPVLARVNRAGFLTDDSQPASDETGADGRHWWQRAAVSGFVTDEQMLDALTRVADSYQLTILIREAGARFPGPRVTVTRVDGEPYTRFGGHLTPEDLRHIWQGLSEPAVAELVDAWQVTLVDPQFGRNDRLWTALNAALELQIPA